MTEGFGPKLPGFNTFIFGNHEALKKKLIKIQPQLWLSQLWEKVVLKKFLTGV